MNMLKLAKNGINQTSITSAKQAARILDGINAEEVKAYKEKQAQQQREEQRHRETIELEKKSLEVAEKSMKLAEDSNAISIEANKKSDKSNHIALFSMILACVSILITLAQYYKIIIETITSLFK